MKRGLFALLIPALILTACNSNSNHLVLPTQRMYVATFNNTPPPTQAGIEVFTPPFSASELPSVVLNTGGTSQMNDPGDVAVDALGNVFAINDANGPGFMTAYSQPISSASAPYANFTTVANPAQNAYGMGFDPSGNLWFSDREFGNIYMVSPPFSNASVPTLVLSAANGIGALGPAQLAFDRAGDLAVAQQPQKNVLFFKAPVTSGSSVAATLPLPQNGQGVAFDFSGRLFATSIPYTFLGPPGSILVFNPPFFSGETPAFSIPEPNSGNGGLNFLTFDGFGDLWAPLCGGSGGNVGMDEFVPPFSASSTPVLSMNMKTATTTCIYGAAFGP
jgi:hypothetical protein